MIFVPADIIITSKGVFSYMTAMPYIYIYKGRCLCMANGMVYDISCMTISH